MNNRQLFQRVKSVNIQAVSKGNVTPIATISTAASSTLISKAKRGEEKTIIKKTPPEINSRRGVQTRAMTKKAKKEREFAVLNPAGRSKVRRSLFASNEDVHIQLN